MLPHFLIIGAHKSATSFLQTALSSHPEIFIPRGEIPFFENPEYGDGDPSPLKILYRTAPPGARLGLKRPNYLAKPECPERIAHHIPDAKLIVLLREPVSRVVSAYYHQMRIGFLPCVELNDGLRDLIDGKYRNKYPRSSEILEAGLYAKHLRRYLEFFPRENFYISSQEELLSNKAKSINDMCNFLSVNPTIMNRTQEKIVNEGVYSLPRVRMHQVARSLINIKSPDGLRLQLRRGPLAEIKKGVGYAILAFDKLSAGLASNEKPNLNAELRMRISDFYKEDLANLELLLGPDFPRWGH